MSTKSSLIYVEGKENYHNVEVHVYHEMHDDLIYLEIGCSTCNSGIKLPLDKHLGTQLADLIKERTNHDQKEG
jgi:hypothetical protein